MPPLWADRRGECRSGRRGLIADKARGAPQIYVALTRHIRLAAPHVAVISGRKQVVKVADHAGRRAPDKAMAAAFARIRHRVELPFAVHPAQQSPLVA